MKKAILTVGVSCSGKTTWSQEFVDQNPRWVIVCRDDIREKILYQFKKIHPFTWDKWNWGWEKDVSKEQGRLFELYASYSSNLIEGIIVSDTHLSEKYVKKETEMLENLGYLVEKRIFHVDWDEAVKRDNLRRNGVGIAVLAKQFQQYHAAFSRQYLPSSDFPKAIIVDLDGTLAQKASSRSWYEWERVGEDAVFQPLRDMLVNLSSLGWSVLLVSGRDGCCRKQTEQWLEEKVNIPFKKLFMRRNKDNRDDALVKEEIFWEQIANYFNVQLVIDDRPKTCRMWRKLNIPVLQAGNPLIEF